MRPLSSDQLMKCDVYSLGILTYEVFAAKEPYEGLPLDLSKSEASFNNMSPPVLDVARKCWSVDWDQRITAKKFLVKWNSI